METIPNEIKKLQNDFLWSNVYLTQYKKLFEFNSKRIFLLDQTASMFFAVVQELLWHEIIISITRLTDKHEVGSNRNNSINIIPYLEIELSWDLDPDIEILITQINEKSQPFREWRNKRIAHRDMLTVELTDDMLDELLGEITFETIEEIHSLIGKLLIKIFNYLGDEDTTWQSFSSSDTDELIKYLKLGAIYMQKTENLGLWDEMENDIFISKFRDA